MRLLHSLARTRASFDDPNLVSQAGLVPVMALAGRAGLAGQVAEHVRPGGERGLNALAAVVSTPLSAPVIAATRLRGGNAASARGAASLAARAIGTARDCGCTGMIVVRLDSAFYNAAVIGAIRRGDARFSVTAPMNASIRAAIAAIGEEAWTAIKYPHAIWDDQLRCWS